MQLNFLPSGAHRYPWWSAVRKSALIWIHFPLHIRQVLEKYGVAQYLHTSLSEVREDSFGITLADGSTGNIPFDYAYICLGMQPEASLLAGAAG